MVTGKSVDGVRAALLALGLEDWISLPEAVETRTFEGLLAIDDSLDAVSLPLLALLREGRIQVWCGPWQDEEPALIGTPEAEEILLDPRRYSLDGEDHGTDRVFYSNVDNFRG